MKMKTDILIQAPVGKTFLAFSDLSKLESRVAGIRKVEILQEPAQMAVGTKWRETREMFGKEATEVMWVTELNKNKNIVVEAESHGAKYRSEYTFVEEAGGTRVSLVFEGRPQTLMAKLMSVMFFFFAGATRKALEQDMQDMKTVLES